LDPLDNHCVRGVVKVSHLEIKNFSGVKKASLLLPDHAVLIGDNNTGKSTVLEALDLALGPDRLSDTTGSWPAAPRPKPSRGRES
jgi:hypothetical protein